MKTEILGFLVDNITLDQCSDSIFSSMLKHRKTWLACFNPHSYIVSRNDTLFFNALRSSDYLVADGVGVLIASRILRRRIFSRVTGSDIFNSLHDRMNESVGMRVFFLGSTQRTLSLIEQRLAIDWPNIEVAGVYAPPFKEEFSSNDKAEMIAAISVSRPDVLWVGLTAPKQEKLIMEILPHLDVVFAGAIGAVFDFYAGTVQRPHPFFQRHGLEWLPRLLKQPRKLWSRMFISAPLFMLHVLWGAILKTCRGKSVDK